MPQVHVPAYEVARFVDPLYRPAPRPRGVEEVDGIGHRLLVEGRPLPREIGRTRQRDRVLGQLGGEPLLLFPPLFRIERERPPSRQRSAGPLEIGG